MSQYAIITDLNKCVGCLACVVACKTVNEVPIGKFWNNVLRVGPTQVKEGDTSNKGAEMYFMPVGCQHCATPQCVDVCPTGASYKLDDGRVVVDPEACIGCGLCLDACPYDARYINDEKGVAEKCTLCSDLVDNGELPQCCTVCNARARFFGDLDEGIESFKAPGRILEYYATYDDVHNARVSILDATRPFTDADIHRLPDEGNGPQFAYILRDKVWQGF